MRPLLLVLLFSACGAPGPYRSPLLPTEFHLTATRTDYNSTGEIDSTVGPLNFDEDSSGVGYSLGFGLTWSLVSPSYRSPAAAWIDPQVAAEIRDNVYGPELPPGWSGGGQPAPDPPDESDWGRIIAGISSLILAIATWLGRNHIPGVRMIGKGQREPPGD